MMANSLMPDTNNYATTKQLCKQRCDEEPECKYYIFGLNDQTCELYIQAKKGCSAVIGSLGIENCFRSKLKSIFHLSQSFPTILT